MTIRLKYLFALAIIATTFASCFEDNTTIGTPEILSDILIDSTSINKVYNIDQHETLTIKPRITQTNQAKELTYTWEIDLKTYSNEEEFVYVGKELGSYQCRLIVGNEDGKSFFPFVLHVNTAYEEGLTVISKNAEGKAMLSFMLTPADGSDPIGFKQGDQFSLNNEKTFADNPTDIVQSSGQLIISCLGSEDGSSPATLYSLNEKTFVLENTMTAPGFDDFKPTFLGIPGTSYSGRSYPILCEGGHTYEFSTTEGTLINAIKLPHTYAQTAVIHTESGGYYNFICWDNELKALALIYRGYAPAYYCSKEYHTNRDSILVKPSRNIFPNKKHEICKIVPIEQNRKVVTIPQVLVVTRVESNGNFVYYRALVSVEFWEYINAENKLVCDGPKVCGSSKGAPLAITETTPCVASNEYTIMLYADGNKIYRWNYAASGTSNYLSAAKALQTTDENEVTKTLTFGSESAIITSMLLSEDQTKTYVAFYEPEQEGLNGSIWVIDTDKGTVLNQYNNVCYQPVKVIYKKK